MSDLRGPWRVVQGAGINWIEDADGQTICEAIPSDLVPLLLAVPEMVTCLRRLVERDPGAEGLMGDTSCFYCGGDQVGAGVVHEPDCPYLAGRRFLDSLTPPAATSACDSPAP